MSFGDDTYPSNMTDYEMNMRNPHACATGCQILPTDHWPKPKEREPMKRDIAVSLKPEEVVKIQGVTINVIEVILTSLREHGRVYVEDKLFGLVNSDVPTLAELLFR